MEDNLTREINLIVIHCSATDEDMDIGEKEIDQWHRARGWKRGCGYHFVIRRYGTIEIGREINVRGAHTKGKNSGSIGICMVGGIDDKGNPENNFNQVQFDALDELLSELLFMTNVKGDVEIKGHYDFSNKACPSFDVEKFKKNRGFK
jgi:hypothetical protein